MISLRIPVFLCASFLTLSLAQAELTPIERKAVTACLEKADGKPSLCLPKDRAYKTAAERCSNGFEGKQFEHCLSSDYLYNSYIFNFESIFGAAGKAVRDRCAELNNNFPRSVATCLQGTLKLDVMNSMAGEAKIKAYQQDLQDLEAMFPVNHFWNGLSVPYHP